MTKFLRNQYAEIVDKIRAGIATSKPYLDKIQKVSISLSFRLAIVIVIVISIVWSGKFIWKHLTNRNMFMVSPVTFSFETPDWVTDKFINEIKNIPGLDERYNMFEKDLTNKVVSAYEKSPLISKVYNIERELPNRINLKFELRRPVAIVKRKSKKYLVDKDCARLPDKFYEYPEEGNSPVYIVGNGSVKVPEYGEKWNDKSIEEGIKLLNYLKYNKIDRLLKIASIDVSNVCARRKGGKIDIIIWTKNGAKIKWGCPPSCEQLDELSNYEKLQNLLSVAKEEGAGLTNMEYVDVRWETPLAKRISVR
ncbi:MAG: hypothetical protein SCARUB_01467 [Candidatus Scalindua rubra]|uniref:POTRA domain-containing protein n=1 Tax=Candidatus Scalindua rubra TaxID=1872076 RepID=A0A1E3XCU9_9BACT|nr:MAG: hypothetical protein SCARUB_01467 [Candidatus Scalindua rubra]